MVDSTGTHAYAYDDLHRLISADHPEESFVPTKNEVFDYDEAGNRKFDAHITDYHYDAANRLLWNSSYTYSYDGNGNQTHKTSKATGEDTEYLYNSENQLIEVKVGTSSIARFQYDGLGRRIEKSTGPVESPSIIKYVYDNEDILAMLDGQDNLIAVFTHGPGIDEPLIMKKADGTEYYLHADALGSIVAVTDSNGDVVERIEYEAYGKPVFVDAQGQTHNESRIGNPYAFTGREWDASSGLYFYRARYYSPRIGRFLQEDPLLTATVIEGAGNPFVYARNSPANFNDAFGLLSRPDAVGGSIGFTGIIPGIGGGIYGINAEKTSGGLDLYGMSPPKGNDPSGVLISFGGSVNIAWGRGPWEGVFRSVTTGIPWFGLIGLSFSRFDNKDYVGYEIGFGVTFGFGVTDVDYQSISKTSIPESMYQSSVGCSYWGGGPISR